MSEQTPHHGHAPIGMKRVGSPDEVNNLGEFAWGDVDGRRHIMLGVPARRIQGDKGFRRVFLPVEGGARLNAGLVNSDAPWNWDGNEDAPTLTPSVHTIGHWHGWIEAGKMVEA